jgi:superoxide dismutase, Fe-Mn family
MPFTLKPLPFPKDSLEPTMSARTIDHHYGKHHATYVNKLNELIAGSAYENQDLESIIKATAKGEGKDKKIFNNAAQVWNHDFFWDSVAPNGGQTPPENLLKHFTNAFGSFESFRDKFVDAAINQFGSGWAWLVVKDGKFDIMTTANADCPMTHGIHALWTCDVWEHAYYLDHQQNRAGFVKAVIENVANWQFVGLRLAQAK